MDVKISDSPQRIYSHITSRMRETIGALDINVEDKDLEDARVKVVAFLNQQYEELRLESEKLQQNADWDTFTIAFYGETNAGKSTLIETLRIALHEPTKQEERAKFTALAKILDIDDSRIESMATAVQALDAQISENQTSLDDMERTVADEKRTRTFYKKLLGIFKKTLAQIELQELRQQQDSLRRKKEENEKALVKMQASMQALANCADGRIVGDGRPDFTRTTHRYLLDGEKGRIAVLDVPGIEGQESAVQDEILAALQKAHAVFYVTWKAAPPQVGDRDSQAGGSIGTLEKIKQHLGAQSEVWTIFNKRINNPLPLRKEQLLNAGEWDGIKTLDEAMAVHLGKHYQGTIPLSAYPAFLAVADCLAPGSEKLRNRKKFLKSFDSDLLLGRSNFKELLDRLYQLCADAKSKIWRSNLNKANFVLRQIIEQTDIHHKNLEKHGNRIEREIKGAESQLDISLQTLKLRMTTLNKDMVKEFSCVVRKEITDVINLDVSNDDFKNALEALVKENIAELEQIFQKKIQERLQAFQDEVVEVLSILKKHLDDLQSLFEKSNATGVGNNLNITVNIHNGINWLGLVGSGASIGAAVVGFITATGGTGAIALAVAGVIVGLISAWKSLRGWLSSDYKTSQQHEAASKVISKISSDLDDALTENMKKPYADLEEKLETIKSELDSAGKRSREIPRALKAAIVELKKIASGIDRTINAA